MSNKDILRGISGLTALTIALSGCKAVEASRPVDPNDGPTPVTSPLPDSMIDRLKATPTFEVGLDKTALPTAAPTEIPINAGGSYEGKMEEVVNNAESQVKLNLLKESTNHWVDDLKLFLRGNIIDYKPIFNSPNGSEAKTMGWVLQVRDPQTGDVTMRTVAAGDFGNQEVVNKPPIEITAGDDQHLLMFDVVEGQGETFVRMDQQGKITQFVDKKTGMWSEVDNFADLSVCRNLQEAVKCPIKENDFKRISKFVKANFKFPAEALKLGFLADVSDTGGNTFMLWPSTEGLDPALAAKIDKGGINGLRSYVYGTSLSPVGQPFFFNLPANGSRVTEPIVVAVYPINNADGSLGTYTIVAPPYITINKEFSVRETAAARRQAFQRIFYCPPVYTMGNGRQEFYDRGEQGTWSDEVFKDTVNPNGTRTRLLDDFKSTRIASAEMEETPFFFTDISTQVDFLNK